MTSTVRRIANPRSRMAMILYTLLLTSLCLLIFMQARASALSGVDFRASNIIDDSVFYNGTDLSLSQVQAFLNARVPVCDTNGTQPYGGTSRAVYGAARGYPPPFTCLKDYRQNVSARAPEEGLCNGISAGSKSAAEIIHEVGVSCGISQRSLIVLLQKEQSLVTDDWPWSLQYNRATGYACPDSGPNNSANCDQSFYGFFNQLYSAARQFKRYARSPQLFNHGVGRTSFVRYNPNASCGGTNVLIENSATAGLYNYTPYQPNQPALNNLYGTGDGCSAYGNRNFWRMFNDWFGPTIGSDFLRSPENATVYLIVDNAKHPIGDANLISAMYQLGTVRFTSQQYLDAKTTGKQLKRLIRHPNGTVYFYDAGIKLPFGSCAAIGHYGLSCGDEVNLTEIQLQKLATGPLMTSRYQTTTGKRFYMENGKKREVFDITALQNAALNGSFNVLSETGINYLAYGNPIIRNGVVIQERGTDRIYLYQQNTRQQIPRRLFDQTILLTKLPKASLDTASVSSLTGGTTLSSFVRNSAGTAHYMIDLVGKAPIGAPGTWAAVYQVLSDDVLALMPNSWQPMNNQLVKSPDNGTVYYVSEAKKRPIADWNDLLRLHPSPLAVNTVSQATIAELPTGVRLIGPARLVKTSDNGTVYVIDGLSKKHPITTFSVPIDVGIGTSVTTIPKDILDSYATTPANLLTRIRCGGKNYLASQGAISEVPANMQSHYGFAYTELDASTCANIPKTSTALNRFLRVANGTIYYVENGKKRPFASFTKYLEYGGTAANTVQVSDFAATQLPSGTIAN